MTSLRKRRIGIKENRLKKQGRLVVIEGTDGSGKATQIKLLEDALKKKKVPTEVIDFPRYEDNMYGQMVGKYLRGEFGSVYDLDPHLITLMYAGDRFLAKPILENWLAEGKVILANRYISSNKANSGMIASSHRDFYKWNDELEYETNGMPKEDIVIVLYVPPKVGMKNVDGKGHRNYLGRHGKDMHEADLKYQQGTAKAYLELAKLYPHWVVVECTKKGVMRSKEEIHQEILEILKDKKII